MNRFVPSFAFLALLFVTGETPAPSPPSVDDQLIFFYYADIGPATLFYEEVLGFEKTFDEGWVRIFRSSPSSYVGVVDETRGYHRVAETKPVMLSIVTDEVDHWYEHLTEAGVPILSELADASDSPTRGFLVEDPGGYTVEFFQWQ